MKKIAIFNLCVICLLFLCGCGPNYDGWKTVELGDKITFKIPIEWVYSEQDGKKYITDRELGESGCIAYFVQAEFLPNSTIGEEGTTESNCFFNEIQLIDIIESTVISNGAVYGTVLATVDSIQRELFFLELNYVYYVAPDDSIDEQLLIKLAKSYASLSSLA